MKTEITLKHYSELAKGDVVHLFPTHVQKMLSGVERLTQNRKGVVTMHYERGTKKSVPMCDFNLVDHTDFIKAFRSVWGRSEGLS